MSELEDSTPEADTVRTQYWLGTDPCWKSSDPNITWSAGRGGGWGGGGNSSGGDEDDDWRVVNCCSVSESKSVFAFGRPSVIHQSVVQM